MTTPTDLIAQAEAVMDGVTPGNWAVEYKHGTTRLMMGDSCQMCDETYYPWTPDNGKDWHFIAWCRAGVPALIARIRELEGERDEWIAAYRSCAKDTLELTQRAEAAEAKLAEVTASNAEWTEFCVKVAQDEMRATVATLTAQVEAMRLSAMKAMTIANGALDLTATEKTFRRDLVQIREELRGALWPAALTTENQTNG